MKEKLKLRGWVKTTIVIILLYLIFISYLLIASNRIEDLDNKGDTRNDSIVLVRESE